VNLREYLIGLGEHVYQRVAGRRGQLRNRLAQGVSPSGDAQFGIDEVAEEAVWEYVTGAMEPVALFSEGAGLREVGTGPKLLLVVDPIDGTRPCAAGLEMATISVAAAWLRDEQPTIADVEAAHLKELKAGAFLYAERGEEGILSRGYPGAVPALSSTTELRRMFWSIEFNGHPAARMVRAYGHLIDLTANTGGIFVFNSASYSLSRIITGQLDAYVDIGNRLLRDEPGAETDFRRVGNGHILHLFPYDIAASVFLAQRAGVVITDAYGHSLEPTSLLDTGPGNQQSCIAASTPQLHQQLLETIRWRETSGEGP
jgi:myo-inositol-1(or 4)-monophosphatase